MNISGNTGIKRTSTRAGLPQHNPRTAPAMRSRSVQQVQQVQQVVAQYQQQQAAAAAPPVGTLQKLPVKPTYFRKHYQNSPHIIIGHFNPRRESDQQFKKSIVESVQAIYSHTRDITKIANIIIEGFKDMQFVKLHWKPAPQYVSVTDEQAIKEFVVEKIKQQLGQDYLKTQDWFTSEVKETLETLDNGDGNQQRWVDNFKELANYKRIRGHANPPTKGGGSGSTKLRVWVQTQRVAKSGKKERMTLSDAKKSLLDAIGFSFDETSKRNIIRSKNKP
ncbi:MAG: hypothetical protein ACJARD_000047 [Alphaproteobacteria bacterium]|jgi:hypothetical protein